MDRLSNTKFGFKREAKREMPNSLYSIVSQEEENRKKVAKPQKTTGANT